ncbi:hypothetical protein [Flexivirga caeni]|uniref:Uncharacterized protein n=1 Tax=Flexivirga caeni TaxID=2294115 RepID=A0A3M9MCG8_9MICO|nr:hypothetical protein [Flexivirga caeni]RNI23236.1 hypothetical protein EFY87_07335 [Flexivirga caeni]
MASLPPRALFTQLIDDAAVFPPGNYSLSQAIERRSARRGTPAADFVGPLLLPPRLVDDALADHSALVITVVGRPDTPVEDTVAAAERVAGSTGHSLAGVEVAAVPGWDQVLELAVPVAVEVPAGAAGLASLPDIEQHDGQVIAKLRTGSTPATPVPATSELAAFIAECVRTGMPFKLTGGLHHAIAHAADGEDQFGFLGVLLATHAALTGGDVSAPLDGRDADAASASLTAMTETDAGSVRNFFTSFGCCDVLDPVHDLSALGLI